MKFKLNARHARILTAAMFTAALTACGGGEDLAVATTKGTLSAPGGTQCKAPANNSACAVALVVTSANASTTLAVVSKSSGSSFAVTGVNTAAGSATVMVPVNTSGAWELKDGTTVLDTINLDAICADAMVVDLAVGGWCAQPGPT